MQGVARTLDGSPGYVCLQMSWLPPASGPKSHRRCTKLMASNDALKERYEAQIAYLKTQLLKVLQRRQSCEGV